MTVTGALADDPIAGVSASVSVITRGGLHTVTCQLAIEYANPVNAVASGAVGTPPHKDDLKDFLRPLGKIGTAQDMVDANLYLAETDQVTGEALHVDGSSRQAASSTGDEIHSYNAQGMRKEVKT